MTEQEAALQCVLQVTVKSIAFAYNDLAWPQTR
jgi:hypothetical protein